MCKDRDLTIAECETLWHSWDSKRQGGPREQSKFSYKGKRGTSPPLILYPFLAQPPQHQWLQVPVTMHLQPLQNFPGASWASFE